MCVKERNRPRPLFFSFIRDVLLPSAHATFWRNVHCDAIVPHVNHFPSLFLDLKQKLCLGLVEKKGLLPLLDIVFNRWAINTLVLLFSFIIDSMFLNNANSVLVSNAEV